VALAHLAQVAGFPDADRLEWHCEAEIAGAPAELHHGDYTATVRAEGADAVIEVVKAGKRLRAVPAELRKQPGYPRCGSTRNACATRAAACAPG
jgi:hypothetical protein